VTIAGHAKKVTKKRGRWSVAIQPRTQAAYTTTVDGPEKQVEFHEVLVGAAAVRRTVKMDFGWARPEMDPR